MRHVELVNNSARFLVGGKEIAARLTGRFYTPESLCDRLAQETVDQLPGLKTITICDPFGGDGRLLVAALRAASKRPDLKRARWTVLVWDCDGSQLGGALERIESEARSLKLAVTVDARKWDTFLNAKSYLSQIDCVITNPPWEAIKPDHRELRQLSQEARREYEVSLREYDRQLAGELPESQPSSKFAGWGTNLSRCGLELAIRLLRIAGVCGIVLPSSVLTDRVSERLRRFIFTESDVHRISYYPAETRIFRGVDQNIITIILTRGPRRLAPSILRYSRGGALESSTEWTVTDRELQGLGYCVPLDVDPALLPQMLKWRALPLVSDFEGTGLSDLWLGRELDETRLTEFTTGAGSHAFVKGRMVSRFSPPPEPTMFVREDKKAIPESAKHTRITWRDVSRRSQARRVQATLLPPSFVTGNSLHVGYFRDDDADRLHALLALFNSIPFEFQVRSRLGTGHVSLGAVRQVHVPDLRSMAVVAELSEAARATLAGRAEAEAKLEAVVACAYGLDADTYALILSHFTSLPDAYKKDVLAMLEKRAARPARSKGSRRNQEGQDDSRPCLIPNHYTASMSKMDLDIAVSVPPGGNWKDVPTSIPSKRLETIRVSYAAGEGSRSTYYGRLRPDRPSYTINTYFNRPGNGCHLHYDFAGGQHRVLSEREAARLQSFPDSFVFKGNHESVRKQIGNAVPPLLAYQIARTLPFTGRFVDLFSGAGGLSLGFKWAGWTPVVANDIERSFLDTYRANVHDRAVVGDIADRTVFADVVAAVNEAGRAGGPLFVIGGPPCQGFSTAGKRRTLDDSRNHLFKQFKELIHAINPDGFIFENVTGLLNMDGGAVFEMIRDELQTPGHTLTPWLLQAEKFAVPQRRTRLFLLSLPKNIATRVSPPPETTGMKPEANLFAEPRVHAVTVEDAIGDLPPLDAGQNGSHKAYRFAPQNPFQSLMRSAITPEEYIRSLAGDGTREALSA